MYINKEVFKMFPKNIFPKIILPDKKKSVYLHAQFEWGKVQAALLTKSYLTPPM